MDLPVKYDELDWPEKRAVREEYIKRQGGMCSHCAAPLAGEPAPKVKRLRVDARRFPSKFFRYPVHLHHNRKTGLTIGAVHNHCNAVLWQHHGE